MKPETLLKIVAWERAYKTNPDLQTIVELFQELIDTGEIQDMGQYYMDAATGLINYGYCHRPELKVVK